MQSKKNWRAPQSLSFYAAADINPGYSKKGFCGLNVLVCMTKCGRVTGTTFPYEVRTHCRSCHPIFLICAFVWASAMRFEQFSWPATQTETEYHYLHLLMSEVVFFSLHEGRPESVVAHERKSLRGRPGWSWISTVQINLFQRSGQSDSLL